MSQSRTLSEAELEYPKADVSKVLEYLGPHDTIEEARKKMPYDGRYQELVDFYEEVKDSALVNEALVNSIDSQMSKSQIIRLKYSIMKVQEGGERSYETKISQNLDLIDAKARDIERGSR